MRSLSGTGVWSSALVAGDADQLAETAATLEALGYTSLWLPTFAPGIFEKVERALDATRDLVVATGVLNVWLYPAAETADRFAQLTEAYGDRFVLGLGVSHAALVENLVPGVAYVAPLQKMATYLDELDAAPTPVPRDRRVLAALGPRMLELASTRAGGAHPYNVTPDHTAIARAALGHDAVLVPEQAVALTTEASEARRWGRSFLERSLTLPNYANNLRRLGFSDADLADGGSDRLVDALVAWGDAASIATRVHEHRDAGADAVCVQVLGEGPAGGMLSNPLDVCRALAPVLL